MVGSLKPRVARGPGGLRNERLTALLFNDHQGVSSKVKQVFLNLHTLTAHIATGNLPWYFFVSWTTTSLTDINKVFVANLFPGAAMECQPVAKVTS